MMKGKLCSLFTWPMNYMLLITFIVVNLQRQWIWYVSPLKPYGRICGLVLWTYYYPPCR